MSVNDYIAPEEVRVSACFMIKPFSEWSFPQFKEYNDDLEVIKKSSLVDRNVKSQIHILKQTPKHKLKGKKWQTASKEKQVFKIVNITYKDQASHNEYNSTIISTQSAQAEEPCSSATQTRSPKGKERETPAKPRCANIQSTQAEEPCTTEKPSTQKAEARMSLLFNCVYKLNKDEDVDFEELSIQPATTVKQKMYNECITLLKEYKKLTPLEKSKLNVLLSSCLNTVSVDSREAIKNIVNPAKLKSILDSKPARCFSELSNTEWVQLKRDLGESYEVGGKKGLQKFVVRERCRIYENDLESIQVFRLMILDIYESVLSSISLKNWRKEGLSKEDFGCYWKSVLDIIFRGTSISLVRYSDGNEKKKTKLITCREESCCLASRHERQVNEYEYAITVSNMYGRKIDLIMKCVLYDDRNQKRDLELSSVEIKPIDVSEDVEAIQ
ncbi:hypothetical protein RO3G_02469 [Rhizopus delemar RA 99-880]|uniref:Uncharacterized protein n=1 Tax=Rhizopus delemar (strain RA 99-880 / ATCC MYA-4621 / FGSC 9543 / NRRL 43880) TaxID=246409 RepID=I1BNI5_RHIO9|nr:hypothetical protein RO3G_02469 [Rhizopus delemar RA 99-880]|eukprot:EIE77765.1 hypothetical protein RO3G_02469 [Rhizopus delemar RA 99-880]